MASNDGTNKPSRDVLPIPDITPPGLTTFDAKLDLTVFLQEAKCCKAYLPNCEYSNLLKI